MPLKGDRDAVVVKLASRRSSSFVPVLQCAPGSGFELHRRVGCVAVASFCILNAPE